MSSNKDDKGTADAPADTKSGGEVIVASDTPALENDSTAAKADSNADNNKNTGDAAAVGVAATTEAKDDNAAVVASAAAETKEETTTDPNVTVAPTPKKRGRPPKNAAGAPASKAVDNNKKVASKGRNASKVKEESKAPVEAVATGEEPKKKRGRPPKKPAVAEAAPSAAEAPATEPEKPMEEQPKEAQKEEEKTMTAEESKDKPTTEATVEEKTAPKKRGRAPKKAASEVAPKEEVDAIEEVKAENAPAEKPAQKKRGRPPKKAAAVKENKEDDVKEDKEAKKPKSEEVAAEDKTDEKVKKEDVPNEEEQKDDEDGAKQKMHTPRKRKEVKASVAEDNAPGTGTGREKRARKSAESFAPENFKETQLRSLIHLTEGRGTRLADITRVKESIEKSSLDDAIRAHKFIFPARGKPNKKEIKSNLLDFSGYLVRIDDTVARDEKAKEKHEKEDEAMEEKMSMRAYKLTIPELKFLCDFFKLDRRGMISKDNMIEGLLNFLSSPDEKMIPKVSSTSGATKKVGRPKKAAGPKDEKDHAGDEEDDDDKQDYDDLKAGKNDDDDDDDLKNADKTKGKMPTDQQLRQWVQAYVRCFNLKSATAKHAVETASAKFGVDLLDMKDRIKELIVEEM